MVFRVAGHSAEWYYNNRKTDGPSGVACGNTPIFLHTSSSQPVLLLFPALGNSDDLYFSVPYRYFAIIVCRGVAMAVILKTGYLGFGSFFTDSVEGIVAKASQEDNSPPKALICVDDLCHGIADQLPLGKHARHLFMVDFAAWTFLNHGAFGGVCTPSFKEAERWREHCERQPLSFLDRQDLLIVPCTRCVQVCA